MSKPGFSVILPNGIQGKYRLAPQMSKIVPSLEHFLMTKKDDLEDVLESIEIVEDFTEKLLLKQDTRKNFQTSLESKHNKFVSFLLFYIYNCHYEIFNVFLL